MTTTELETRNHLKANNYFYNDQFNKVINHVLPQFYQVIKTYVVFNIFFLFTILVEFVLFLVFFAFLAKSSLLAISLALVFLTSFSYFILRLYMQTKTFEQLKLLKERFLKSCKHLINYREENPEHHIELANACYKFAEIFNEKEIAIYQLPKILPVLSSKIEELSIWWHGQDIHRIKELLLMSAVEEYIKLVKCEPTSIESHAALANSYVMLSRLYACSKKEGDRSFSRKYVEELEVRFRMTAERAIEELKILQDYAPNDPWVHAQLANSYHDLKMPKEEIRQYEALFRLRPDDKETLYKLGMLYFQQGMNGQGLRVYEELKKTHTNKAEQLIDYYGAYQPFE